PTATRQHAPIAHPPARRTARNHPRGLPFLAAGTAPPSRSHLGLACSTGFPSRTMWIWPGNRYDTTLAIAVPASNRVGAEENCRAVCQGCVLVWFHEAADGV